MPNPTFGSIGEDELQFTLADKGLPEDAGHGPRARFVASLTRLIIARVAKGETSDGAVFLMAAPVADVMRGREGEIFTTLKNGNDAVSGRVWVMSSTLTNAHALKVTWSTGGTFDEIVAAGLAELPAVTVDLRGAVPQLCYFPNGCGDPEMMLTISVGGGPITVDEMKATLDRFYNDNLRTPMTVLDGHGERIWTDSGKGVPMDRPEERIERRLLDRLRSVYPDHRTRAEIGTEDGRVDISLEGKDLSQGGVQVWRCDWVLELKALADMTSGGQKSSADHPAAIAKGLRQAIAYGQRELAIEKALCVYDMRKIALTDAEVFAAFRNDAKANGVHLWRWRLLRSAEEGRKEAIPLEWDAAGKSNGKGSGSAHA